MNLSIKFVSYYLKAVALPSPRAAADNISQVKKYDENNCVF